LFGPLICVLQCTIMFIVSCEYTFVLSFPHWFITWSQKYLEIQTPVYNVLDCWFLILHLAANIFYIFTTSSNSTIYDSYTEMNAATRAAHLFRLWKNILYLNDSVQWCNVIKVKQFYIKKTNFLFWFYY
jgi:hypothetical protein